MACNVRFFCVSEGCAGERLDHLLQRLNPDLSRSRLQNLIANQAVHVDAQPILCSAYKVKRGQNIVLNIPEPEPLDLQPENIPLNLVFEDDHLVVLNKPAGLVVHPSPGHNQGTLVHAILYHCGSSLAGIGDVKRPGIVHRLDKGTSGLMVVAKNDAAHHHLSAQFAAHTLTRQYMAFCWGCPQPSAGVIESQIGRHPQARQKRAVVPEQHGKKAITAYRVLKHHAPISLIQCTLKTGRTHQIRVHMSHQGWGLVGDPLYGRTPSLRHLKNLEDLSQHVRFLMASERPALHSSSMSFEHPATGQTLSFSAPFPEDLKMLETYVTL